MWSISVLVTVIAPFGHTLAQALQRIQYWSCLVMRSNLWPGAVETGNAKASHGQVSTQAPQVWHASWSISKVPLNGLLVSTASVGHAPSHHPQYTQSSSSITALPVVTSSSALKSYSP